MKLDSKRPLKVAGFYLLIIKADGTEYELESYIGVNAIEKFTERVEYWSKQLILHTSNNIIKVSMSPSEKRQHDLQRNCEMCGKFLNIPKNENSKKTLHHHHMLQPELKGKVTCSAILT